MPKPFIPVIVTANDLLEGDSVFLGPAGWTRDLGQARIARTAEEARALEAAGQAGESGNLVVGPYLVEVSLDAGHPWPIARREQIRASRLPTIAVGTDALPEQAAEAA